MFAIILDLLKSIKNDIQNDINKKILRIKKEGLLKILAAKKIVYLVISVITFLFANFTTAVTLIFNSILPTTKYFMIPSSVLLYLITVILFCQFIKSTKDKEFLDKQFKFEEKINIENIKKD